jgi:hypothetical protein
MYTFLLRLDFSMGYFFSFETIFSFAAANRPKFNLSASKEMETNLANGYFVLGLPQCDDQLGISPFAPRIPSCVARLL